MYEGMFNILSYIMEEIFGVSDFKGKNLVFCLDRVRKVMDLNERLESVYIFSMKYLTCLYSDFIE